MSARQLEIGIGVTRKAVARSLRRLMGAGRIQKLPWHDPALPKGLVVYLPTDPGLDKLAEAEGLTLMQCARGHGLTPGRLYRVMNAMPWFYGLRTFFTRLSEAARKEGHCVTFYQEEKLFRFHRSGRLNRFRADAFLVYQAKDVAYPLIVFWDAGYLPVDDFGPQVESLRELREARDASSSVHGFAFPSVAIVTADVWRLLQWQRLLRHGTIRKHSTPVQGYFALRRELLPQDGGGSWRFFQPVWYDGIGGGVRLLQGAKPVPWEDYRRFAEQVTPPTRMIPEIQRTVVGNYLHAPDRSTLPPAKQPRDKDLALVNLHLKRSAKKILLWIGDHPVLQEPVLARFLGVGHKSLAEELARLEGMGLLARVRPEGTASLYYVLTTPGLAWLTRRRKDRHPIVNRRQWEGTVRHLVRTLEHTRAIHEVMMRLHELQVKEPESQEGLYLWDSDFRKPYHYHYRGQKYAFDPDAFGVYRIGRTGFPFYLEVDMGTVRGKLLARKARAYYAWRTSRMFTETGLEFPSILIVTKGPKRVESLLLAFERAGRQFIGPVLPLFVTTFRQLRKSGPRAPMWSTLVRQELVSWPLVDPASLPPMGEGELRGAFPGRIQ